VLGFGLSRFVEHGAALQQRMARAANTQRAAGLMIRNSVTNHAFQTLDNDAPVGDAELINIGVVYNQ